MSFDSGISSNLSVPRWACTLETTSRFNPHARALIPLSLGMETTIQQNKVGPAWEPAQEVHDTLGELTHMHDQKLAESTAFALVQLP